MTQADQLRRALEVLGVYPEDLAGRTEPNLVLQLSNALAGVAEVQILHAEMELGPDAEEEVQAAELNADAASGLADAPEEGRRAMLNWRAARLHNALARAVAENRNDLTLTAARDAVTVALALLSYRSAAELSLSTPEPEAEEVPGTALHAARQLLDKIDVTLRDLMA